MEEELRLCEREITLDSFKKNISEKTVSYYEDKLKDFNSRIKDDRVDTYFLRSRIDNLKHTIITNSQMSNSGLRKINPDQINNWLQKLREAGYKLNPRDSFEREEELYVATKDFEVPALCGASSINIIIPEGIKFTKPHINHCVFYYEDPKLIAKSGYYKPIKL